MMWHLRDMERDLNAWFLSASLGEVGRVRAPPGRRFVRRRTKGGEDRPRQNRTRHKLPRLIRSAAGVWSPRGIRQYRVTRVSRESSDAGGHFAPCALHRARAGCEPPQPVRING
jgi:hypothetical protein